MTTTPAPPPLVKATVSDAPLPVPDVEPTQTVQLEMPPEIVEQLTPVDPGWFTQPVATVTAALIAVLAAVLALGGVWWQVTASDRRTARELRANAASLRKQLRANAVAQEKQLEVERIRAERIERFQLVRETLRQMILISASLIRLHNTRRTFVIHGEGFPGWDEDQHTQLEADLTTSWSIMTALDLTASAAALGEYLAAMDDVVKLDDNPHEPEEVRLAALDDVWAVQTTKHAVVLMSLQGLLAGSPPKHIWNPPTSKYFEPPESQGS